MDRKLGGPQSRYGRDGNENIPSPSRESNPGRPVRSLVTILIEQGEFRNSIQFYTNWMK
jgi:hypothetical protein